MRRRRPGDGEPTRPVDREPGQPVDGEPTRRFDGVLARLVATVLALYPRPIRERYGAEIADLLTHSPTPVRDLADVTWCALADRVVRGAQALTLARARTGVFILAKLLLIPLGLTIALLVLMVAAGPPLNLMVALDIDVERTASMVHSLSILPLGLLAWWLGRRLGRSGAVPAAWALAPTALAVGLLALAALPGVGVILGETPDSATLAILCWSAGTAVTCRLLRTALVHRRVARAWLTGLGGGLVLLTLSTIGYVWSAIDAARAPRGSAPYWYLSAISGIDPGLVDDTHLQLADAVALLPSVLTACTVYAFALTAGAVGASGAAITADQGRKKAPSRLAS
ncbi:hypothetical protein [Plantactinospora soyae]|uniref:Uncharacterized protein n=1 Tax=Plantactinospora soyae TaxID=1544732 RepID=A0A927MD24_9ACTN|nr:hypothetical protein [Plantactinospora soyae]MBE1492259.1 hypothetical protein [Plantactinospora soyae]